MSQTSDGLYLVAFYWERVPCGVFGNAQFAQALERKKVLGGALTCPLAAGDAGSLASSPPAGPAHLPTQFKWLD